MTRAALTVPRRIVLVGGGGREHALAWKLASEPGFERLVALPGSPAMASLPGVTRRPEVDPLDPAAVVAVARASDADLVVVGPEAPLAAGVADALELADIPVFGATAAAARIETSKAWCHEIAEAAGVPMARAGAFADPDAAGAFARALDAAGQGIVVKADGLAAGKGVTVATDLDEALAAIEAAARDGRVIIEERLEGPEASCIALCDGRDAVALPIARDHKRLGDGDTGPNTGGMGAYSPLPDLPDAAADALLERFHRPILAELARRGTPFRGALYAGLMLTAAGPRLLECNARFGDPETQAILPRLAGPLGPWLVAAANGELAAAVGEAGLTAPRLPVVPEATVAVVLAAAGYPSQPRRGDRIDGLDAAAATGALVFHAGTSGDTASGWQTAGGRVLAVVGRGAGLPSARATAETAADRIDWPGMQRRRDIAAIPVAGTPVAAAAAR